MNSNSINNLNKIINTINSRTLEQGEAYFNAKKVFSLTYKKENSLLSIDAICNGYSIDILLRNDNIEKCYCECSTGRYSIVCKHITAAILYYKELLINEISHKKYDDSAFIKELSHNNLLDCYVAILEAKNLFTLLIKKNRILLLNENLFTYERINEKIASLHNHLSSCSRLSLSKIEINDIDYVVEKIKAFNTINSIYNKDHTNIFCNNESDEIIKNIVSLQNDILLLDVDGKKFDNYLYVVQKPTIDIYIFKTNLGYTSSTNMDIEMFFASYQTGLVLYTYENVNTAYSFDITDYEHLKIFPKLNYHTKSRTSIDSFISKIESNIYFDFNIINQICDEKIPMTISLFLNTKNDDAIFSINLNDMANQKTFLSKTFNIPYSKFSLEDNNHKYVIKTKEMYESILNSISLLQTNCEYEIDLQNSLPTTSKKQMVDIKFNIHDDKISYEYFYNDLKLSEAFVKKLILSHSKQKIFFSHKKQIFSVDDFNFEKIDKLNCSSNNHKKEQLDINNVFYMSKIFDQTELKNYVDLFLEKKVEINCSKHLLDKLKPYQHDGAIWLKRMLQIVSGCILADEMGLGKTIQTIALLEDYYLNCLNKDKKTLIVVPLSVLNNWYIEINKFSEKLKATILYNKKHIGKLINDPTTDIFITTYEVVVNNTHHFNKLNLKYLILDEAQYIKNNNSLRFKKIKKIVAEKNIALTGTPIENNLIELWTLFDFIIPHYLINLSQFKKKYASVDSQKLKELSLKTSFFILRRTKKEQLANLPSKNINEIIIPFNEEEKNLYNKLLLEFNAFVDKNIDDKNIEKSKILILSLILKLRKFSCSPALLNYQLKHQSKIDKCVDIVTNILESNNSKILIFCNFLEIIDILASKFKCFDPIILTGAIRQKQRVQIIEQFNSNESNKILLCSLKAGGIGLNLTSANYVINFSPWWNEAAEQQAIDRSHRIGQKKDVYVYKLLMADSIEEDIKKIKTNKNMIINQTISNVDFKEIISVLKNKKL